jgi:cytoskeletal protein CcmA (bactofilin family)
METRISGWRRMVLGADEPGVAPVQPASPELEPAAAREPGMTLIEPGVEMNGRLVVPHSLRVEGEFRGAIESAASVFVSESGAVEAPIRARTVEIRGAVVGDIVATREVVIHPTGKLHGNVETPSFVVSRGATFNGRSQMYRPERGAQATALRESEA